jgi:hypothetical protein
VVRLSDEAHHTEDRFDEPEPDFDFREATTRLLPADGIAFTS